MKLFNYLTILLLVSTVISCSTDKSDYFDYTNSASVTTKAAKGFIDLQKLTTEEVSLTYGKNSDLSFEKVALSASYGVNGNVVSVSEATSESGTFNTKVSDILNKLGVKPEDVKVGDVLVFYFDLTSSGKLTRDRDAIILPFSCISDLAGTYSSVTSGSSTDDCCKANPIVDFSGTVTLTKLSDGKYQLNDFSAGLYFEWYQVYGITGVNDTPGKIQDVCGNLTFFDTTEPFSTPITGSGTVSQDGKSISYTWANGYGDTGTVVLTKQ